jgi:two-component system NarL family sensor kinase
MTCACFSLLPKNGSANIWNGRAIIKEWLKISQKAYFQAFAAGGSYFFRMKTRLFLALCFLSGGLFAQSTNVDSLTAVLATATGQDRAKTLIELCWELRFTDADSAREFGLQALELSRKMADPQLEVEALHNVGVTHEAQGNYDEALKYELGALALRRVLGDDVKTANTLNNIGIIHDERGDYHMALEHYYQAHRIYEKAGDKKKIAMVSLNIGVVLKAQADYKPAAKYYGNALKIYEELDNRFGIAACHANLGSVLFYLARYDSSLQYSLVATEEFQQQNILQFLPMTICNAGMAYDKLGRRQEAMEYMLRAVKLNEEYDSKKELAFALIYLSNIYRQDRKFDEARRTALRGLDIATSIDAQQQVLEAREALSSIYADQGRYQEALEQYMLHAAVKDSLFRKEKSKQIVELQAKYESEKKESEIRYLQQENDLKDTLLGRNRVVIITLAILAVVLVVLGYLVRNRLTLRQRVELEETKAALREMQLHAVITSQEEERRRFAADLHDGLGQLISAVKLSLSRDDVEKRSLVQAVAVLNEMNTEIRNIAFNLMPHVLTNSGLREALEELAARINRTEKIRVTVGAFDLMPIHETEKKVALYRICQEWINNVIKYSRCTTINVQLVQHQHELVITMEDNGTGFDPAVFNHSTGNGWKNIHSRLAMIHGHIDIDSMAGRTGTTVIVSVPGLAALAA